MPHFARPPTPPVRVLFVLLLLCLPGRVASLGPLSPRWHLQRIAQRQRLTAAQMERNTGRSPLPRTTAATSVNIYVVDSGVRVSHEEFGGRASSGPDFVDIGGHARDCQGHGTHVAALAAGRFSGVARAARVIAVRILDCSGAGFCADVVRALQWVHDDAARRHPARAVVVLSLGSRDARCGPTVARTDALAALGVVVVAAAGNSGNDSCSVYPARNDAAIAVGATDARDRLYARSNRGRCVDLLAPGVRVVAAWGASRDDEYRAATGTSMATPLVAGTAALVLAADPSLSAKHVRAVLVRSATRGRVRDPHGKHLLATPANRLLYAPWARLFDELPREAAATARGRSPRRRRAAWAALSLGLVPRVRPAMAFSAHMIRVAVAKSCGISASDVVVRRSSNARRLRNGSEPNVIRLRVYVQVSWNGSAVYRRLNRAVGSGFVQNASKENVLFYSSQGGVYVERGAVMPRAIYDYEERVPGLNLDSFSIVALAILCWLLALIAVSCGTCAWKGKLKREAQDESENADSEHSTETFRIECPLTPEITLDVDKSKGEVGVRIES